jgi:hypothetical protein
MARTSSAPDLLAVLGRGVQQVDGHWIPSPDFEVYNGRHHSPTPIPGGDGHPNCRVGGGQLNVDAAVAFLNRTPIPCILGDSRTAKYLRDVGGPSEREVLTQAVLRLLPSAHVIQSRMPDRGPSDTQVEVRHMVSLAHRRGFRHVQFLTVLAHLPRVLLLAERAAGRSLICTGAASELVLLAHRPNQSHRISRLLGSRAFRRTVEMELAGVNGLLTGTYE